METCWASSLGNCSDTKSGEHIITRALFGDSVHIRGYDWCRELKEIGIQSFVTNRLCAKHNSDLSPIDDVGKNFWFALKDLMGHKKGAAFHIDGKSFERWALKCVVNMLSANEKSWKPDDNLVKIIFGMEQIPVSAGLAFISAIGDRPSGEEHIRVGTLLLDDYLHGACLQIRGLDMIVTHIVPAAQLRHPDHPHKIPVYRLRKIDHAKIDSYIQFEF